MSSIGDSERARTSTGTTWESEASPGAPEDRFERAHRSAEAALRKLVPMSRSQKERITALRQWMLEGRAQSASFPAQAPGVGTNATTFAARVAAMSDGQLELWHDLGVAVFVVAKISLPGRLVEGDVAAPNAEIGQHERAASSAEDTQAAAKQIVVQLAARADYR